MSDSLSDVSLFASAAWIACVVAYVAGAVWFLAGMRKWDRPGSGARPFVSVVVAARDEAERIEECVRRILDQDYPKDRYELIVVDDGSRDPTARIVEGMASGVSRLRLLRTEEAYGRSGSKKAALTLGIEAARGEIVLTTDADCRVPPGWIRGMVAGFDGQTGMVVGFSQIGEPGGVKSLRMGYEAVDFLCLMSCILGSAGQGHPMAASGQNLAYRKEAFLQVGGYERVKERASGDDVLLLQMLRRLTPWRIGFSTAPETFVVHPPASSWMGLLRQRVRWASNAPIQLRFDPFFFGYMVVAFSLSLMVIFSPLLVLSGGIPPGWVLAGLGGKSASEFALFYRGVSLFGRKDLLRFFPFWLLVQPVHVVVVGVLGCLGIFGWKGRRHRWGRPR